MRLLWRSPAIRDLEAARQYIQQNDPAAAQRVILRILDAIDLLAQHPGLGRPGRLPNARELIVPDTPYLVPYRVRDGHVDILRVYHRARRWPKRFT